MIKSNKTKYKDIKRKKKASKVTNLPVIDLIPNDIIDIICDKGSEAIKIASNILPSTEQISDISGDIIEHTTNIVGNIVEALGDLTDLVDS